VRCGKRFRRGEGQDVPDRREAGLRGRNLEIVAVLCGWILIMPLSAESFALRGLDKGDSVPDMEFMGITAESGKLSSFSGGKGLIVIYWATWSSRSPMILEFAEKELRTPTTRRCAGRKSKRSRERQRRWPSRSR
jgi:hypothetical protein